MTSTPQEKATPRVSFVIPAFNEEPILETAINDLRERLRDVEFPFALWPYLG